MGIFLEAEKALFARLNATAALLSVIPTTRIKSVLPQDSPLPYLRARVTRCLEYDTKTQNGLDIEYTLDVYSSYHGHKEVLEISQIIYDALHDAPFTLAVGRNFFLRLVSQTTFLEPDGQTSRSTLVFRALAHN